MDYGAKDAIRINQGFVSRHKLRESSQSVNLEGPIYADHMQMDRYILNGCELRLKIHQNSDSFRLVTKKGTNYKVILQDVIFK